MCKCLEHLLNFIRWYPSHSTVLCKASNGKVIVKTVWFASEAKDHQKTIWFVTERKEKSRKTYKIEKKMAWWNNWKRQKMFLLNSVQLFLISLRLVTNNMKKWGTIACFVVKTLDMCEKYIEIVGNYDILV